MVKKKSNRNNLLAGILILVSVIFIVVLLYFSTIQTQFSPRGGYNRGTGTRMPCLDSDASNYPPADYPLFYFIKGKVSYGSRTFTDYCVNSNYLHEYTCFLGRLQNYSYLCRSNGNFTCQDGACVPTEKCADSDGGLHPYIKGAAFSYENGIFMDYCTSPDILNEYYCNMSRVTYTNLNCSSNNGRYIYVCENGKCAPKPYRVFVTNNTYTGNLGGLAGADYKCQLAANQAGLGGVWKAWLSNDTLGATSRLYHSTGPYRLVNHDGVAWDTTLIVALDWDDLTGEGDIYLEHAISRTEYGTPLSSESPQVWTGTYPNGSFSRGSCMGWTTNSEEILGLTGLSNVRSPAWTLYRDSSCDKSLHLYCFEQP